MTQISAMGPPLSPRETRRSGRRSAPSGSASASKSPDSDQPMREKGNGSRTATSSASSRVKKLKQEDNDEVSEDPKQNSIGSMSSSASNTASSNKGRRKTKDKDQHSSSATNGDADGVSMDRPAPDAPEEEEEQGVTRCVCGSAEDDPEAGEFMVQCETCGVWQHGLCMGYLTEDQVQDTNYHCELCKPEMHVELLKKLAKKPRQASTTVRQDPISSSRISRSHSPSYLLKQPSKRRNTMNSRDAAFDESLKEIIEATAAEAEAAAVQDTSMEAASAPQQDTIDNGRKKRKRMEEETNSDKRTRSPSAHPEEQHGPVLPAEFPVAEKLVSQVPKSAGGRNKRGGRKNATIEVATVEIEEANSIQKRPGNNSRVKGSAAVKRPPLSQSVSHGSGAAIHEHGTRRNQSGTGQPGGLNAADSRAYRNSHAYAVSQQTLFTSWNLPDYLSHLEQMLPTDTPQPLEVRSGASAAAAAAGPGSRGESTERTVERGVKVKWPAKRMSVGDMNKRVRALVEWVGREQATGLDRGRRREALEKALREQTGVQEVGNLMDGSVSMPIDRPPPSNQSTNFPLLNQMMPTNSIEISTQTMKMMEELMEELIGFQERFGPGAKNRDRERRLVA